MIDRRTNGQDFNSMSFVLQKLADILQRIYSFSVGFQFWYYSAIIKFVIFFYIVKLFVLVCKVRDVWEWLNCMHVDTSEGGAVMSRCGFWSVCYLEVKICCKTLWDQG